MSAGPGIARLVPAPRQRRAGAGPDPAPAAARARRRAARLGSAWLSRVTWTLERTGRAGQAGVALLLAAAVFLSSTDLRVAAEVDELRAGLDLARRKARTPAPARASDPTAALPPLPAGTEVPALLRQLFRTAAQAQLAVDTGRYELNATKGSGLVRTQLAFPVRGPYPRIREFLDTALATMPSLALSGLLVERRSISDGEVEAQIRVTFYTAAAGAQPAPSGAGAGAPAERVVPPRHATALFAQHAWTVLAVAPVPPPPPPPPPPDPTAPPLPYQLVGSVTPRGEQPVFYLARGDRMISARVGDRLDGVYLLESAAGGQLVFVYLPLDVRQTIQAGVSP